MSLNGSATVTGDATAQILGSDGATAAAININGGSYDVGGTFLALIDGDGAVTFNNAAINADVLKSAVFGTNGTLTVGGGRLSGSTELKLYAPGSSGQVNFISNVTLDSESSVIIAANAVTINNGIVVTITGDDGVNASVFTNVPNYTGSGGNGSTTGMFAGNGATTFPLDQAPPFGPSGATATGATASAANSAAMPTVEPASPVDRSTNAAAVRPRAKRLVPVARVASTNELLALLDRIPSGPAGLGRSSGSASRTTRGASGTSLGKSRAAVQNLDRASMALNRTGTRRPAALP